MEMQKGKGNGKGKSKGRGAGGLGDWSGGERLWGLGGIGGGTSHLQYVYGIKVADAAPTAA